jgi:ammonium transporter, Amt family
LTIDSGDTAWVIVSAALVMFMTPGLAFFYAGMVRARNVLTMLMQNFFCLGLVSVLWAVVVYSIAFGGTNRWIGNFDFAWLGHFDTAPHGVALTIPPALYMSYQLMFAVITPALITGAIADRVRFGAWTAFVGLWLVIVYAPIAHWVFAPAGWLARRGALDFAGGTVVHVNAGIAALAVVLVVGRRRGWPRTPMPPHSLPLTLIGTGILWFGWFGFNAGSALRADGLAVQALVNTHMAAAAAMLGWVLAERVHAGRPTILGAASGAVAGLVAITPCAGFVGGMSPIAIGAITGVVCYAAVNIKFKLLFDDALDVVGVHLVGGVLGSLLLGLFADKAVNPAGRNGVFLHGGGWGLFGDQFVAVATTLVYSFVMTFAIAWIIDRVLPGGMRVDEESEDVGLDLREHSEVAYSFAER